MTDDETVHQDDSIQGLEPLVHAARAYPTEPEGARAQVMARIRREAGDPLRRPQGALTRAWRWLVEPRSVRVSPLLGASAVSLVLVLGTLTWRPARDDTRAPVSTGGRTVQFVFVAPAATSVSLVGDFNDWQTRATPLTRTAPSGVWSVDVPLGPGRHVYAFVVDDVWMADAFAPRAPDSDFGTPTSVVVVQGGGQS